MKNDYCVRAQKFIIEIAPYFEGCENRKEYIYAVGQYNKDYKRHVKFAYGISRIVFITQDYVVKISYRSDAMFGDCESEYNMYLQAQKDGFDYLFAPITRMEYNGNYYYIMPRIPNVGREWEMDEFLSDEERDYLFEHGVGDIDDNYSNVGWKNGIPIIIDYACNEFV